MAIEQAGKRLQKLKGSDYEIADGEPDIRGWDVKVLNGNTIGEVNDLLFDTQLRKVRYMIVDLDNDNHAGLNKKTVLIPIGLAELHTKEDNVLLPAVTTEQLNRLPVYDDDIMFENETAINNVFCGVATTATAGTALNNYDNELYDHDNYNEDNLFKNRRTTTGSNTIPILEENLQVGKQEVETGGVYIKSRIVERPVEETINLKEEHVKVGHTPVDRIISNADLNNLQESTIELTEYAEVPVVSKEARVVEEITVGTEVNEREETVHDSLRHTEVNIEDLNKKNSSTASLG